MTALFPWRTVLGTGAMCVTLAGAAASRPEAWVGNRLVGSPNPPAPYTVERLYPGIRFDQPTDAAFAPGSHRLFVAEQGGRIYSFTATNPVTPPALALDLRRAGVAVDELLGFTFHPGFATNRQIFVSYHGPEGVRDGARVTRLTVGTNEPPTVDPASEVVVITWMAGGHAGSTLAFGPDGMLYISNGDGASPDPPDGKYSTGQDISDLLGGILRIDVDHPAPGRAYSVPRDNPFVDLPRARPEVWAFGMRNPFRMSFGPDGALWVGDVGWEQWEMVYRVRRGGNYGWPITEGPNLRVRSDVLPGPGPILPPIHSVPHTDGASITAGRVYQGARLTELRGDFVYGDWETGRFWALRADGETLVTNRELCDTSLKPVSFAGTPDGDLVILDYSGGFYRLVPNQAPPANQAFPHRLSETGLFASLNPLRPATGVVRYRPNAPMWNDHATAEWLLAIPGNAAIATAGGVGNIAGATWSFPTNTVLARTLTLALDSRDPASARPVETQILHWDGQAWSPYTFRWSDDRTDAELVPAGGTNATFVVTDPNAPGGRRVTPWRFLSRTECLRCHNAWAGESLTLNWLQLGPTPDAPASSELQRLADAGFLRLLEVPSPFPPTLVDPTSPTASVATRARAWLHANCSGCHRFGAGGAAALRVNFDQPAEDMRVLDEKPTRGDFGLTDARIVAPGAPYRSTLLFRIATEGAGHMPHLGTRLVDEAGVRTVRDWIRSLKPRAAEDRAGVRAADAETGPPAYRVRDLEQALAAITEITRAADRVAVADASANHPDAFVRDLFQRWLPPERRRVTLGTEFDPHTVLALAGNVERGRELFVGAAQCLRCHVAGEVGRAFGPNLDGIGRKYTRPQLLEQILQPSKSVAPEFRTTTLVTRDQTESVGFVLARTPTHLLFRDASGIDRRIAVTEIIELQESTLSAMPEGLLAPLTAQEAADLLEYLAHR